MPFIEGMILSHKPFPYVVKDDQSMPKMFDSFPCPRVFKTHLTYGLVPKGQDEATKSRYIYVMRNPKDAAVSFYHLRRNIPFLQENCTWDEFFEKFMGGEGENKKNILKLYLHEIKLLSKAFTYKESLTEKSLKEYIRYRWPCVNS